MLFFDLSEDTRFTCIMIWQKEGRGGGQVVSVLAFYSDDPSSNPAEACEIVFEKNRNKQKEAGVGPFF